MLSLPPAVRIFVSTEPTDIRRGFDGLSFLVKEVIGEDPLSGHLFVFRNRIGDRVKVLYWDRTGFCLWYKRLEKSVFHFPSSSASSERRSVEIEAAELALILEGIDLAGARRRRRFVPSRSAVPEGPEAIAVALSR
jgi:transposase